MPGQDWEFHFVQSPGSVTRLILIASLLAGTLAGCSSPESRIEDQVAKAEAAAQRAEEAAERAEQIARANRPVASFAEDEEPQMPAVEDQLPGPPPPPDDEQPQPAPAP